MNMLSRTDTRVGFWMAALLAVAALAWTGPRAGSNLVFGQEAAAPAPADAVAAEVQNAAADAEAGEQLGDTSGPQTSADDSLAKLIINSGVFGWIFYSVLAIFSIAGMAVGLERLVRLQRGRVIPPAFVIGLKNLVREKQDTPERFRMLCDASPSPIANILSAGLLRAGRPLAEVEKSMEDAAARELADLRSRNKPLDVIGSVAPLVGLLGTVVGMIFAFRISSQAGLGRAELLAEGIYLALMTTAGGLTIAIPCLLLHAWFNASADKFLREIDEALLEAMPCFTRLENQEVKIGMTRNQRDRDDPSDHQPSDVVEAAAVG